MFLLLLAFHPERGISAEWTSSAAPLTCTDTGLYVLCDSCSVSPGGFYSHIRGTRVSVITVFEPTSQLTFSLVEWIYVISKTDNIYLFVLICLSGVVSRWSSSCALHTFFRSSSSTVVIVLWLLCLFAPRTQQGGTSPAAYFFLNNSVAFQKSTQSVCKTETVTDEGCKL